MLESALRASAWPGGARGAVRLGVIGSVEMAFAHRRGPTIAMTQRMGNQERYGVGFAQRENC